MEYSPLSRIGCGQGGILLPRKMPIFYSALMLTMVNLLLRMVGTGFQVYLSRTIGAAGIGLLQLVMSVGSLAMVAGIGGIRTATMYLTAEELGKGKPKNVTWILSGCFLYSILFSGTVAAALYVFAPQLAAYWIGDDRTVDALRLFSSFLPLSCLCGVMTGYFIAANRIGTLALIEVAEQLCSMTATVALLLTRAGSDPVQACLCVILGNSVGMCLTLACLVILRIRDASVPEERIPVRKRLMATALPLALADDLKSGISTAENLMVPKRLYLNSSVADPLSAFGLVSGMVFPVMMFPAAILFGLTELLIPELARCNAGEKWVRIRYLVKKSLHIVIIYGICFGGLIFMLSEDLCILLFKSNEASRFLRMYALMIPCLYCDIITDAMIKGLGQQQVSVRYNILTSFLDVVFLYALLPKYGMGGYFFSFAITHLLNFFLSIRRLIRISGVRVPCSVPVLCSLCAFLSVWAAGHLQQMLLRGISYLLILFCLLFLTGVLGSQDIRWFRGLVAGRKILR